MSCRIKYKTLFYCLAAFLLCILYPASDSVAQGCGFNSINDYICPGGVGARTNPFNPGSEPPPPGYGGVGGGPPPIIGGGTPVVQPPPGDPIICNGSGGFDQFIDHLKQREGVVNCVYLDSLGNPTVGVGHLVLPQDNLQVGDCISDAQVDAFLQVDALNAWNAAQTQSLEISPGGEGAGTGAASGCLTTALASVNYQLGTGWRSKFPNTWNMIQNGQYCEAADSLEGTLWNQQTPVRVDDFQAALREEAANSGNPC